MRVGLDVSADIIFRDEPCKTYRDEVHFWSSGCASTCVRAEAGAPSSCELIARSAAPPLRGAGNANCIEELKHECASSSTEEKAKQAVG